MRSQIVVIAVIAAFAQTAARADDVQIRSFPVLAAPGGRYVFGQISNMRRDQFLLDSQTGRLWTTVNAGSEGKEMIVLEPVPYSTSQGYRLTPSESPAPPQKK